MRVAKNLTKSLICFLLAWILSSCLGSSTSPDDSSRIKPKGLFGILVDASGKPVKGASIRAVSISSSVPKIAASKKSAAGDSVSTDSTGTFVFENLSSGTYNLQGDYNKGALVVLIKDVQYDGNGSIKEIKTDTLRAAGQIAGQVYTHSFDDGGVVCYIPGTSYLAITNDSGQFTISNLPQGSLSLTCRKDGFISASATTIQVLSGKKTELPSKVMEPDPAYPPPAPGNVKIIYDTVAGTARISWSPVSVSDLDGYLVFRNEASSTDPQRITPTLIRDTTFVDSVLKISDSSDLSLIYRIKAQDKNANISTVYSKPDTIETFAPLRSNSRLPSVVFAGDTISVMGVIQSGVPLTSIEISLWSGNTNVSVGKGFVISYSSLQTNRKKWDLESDAHLKIISDTNTSREKYSLKILVHAGKRTLSDSMVFDLTDEKVIEKTLSAGAQNSAVGSSIDLDNFFAYTINQAIGVSGQIDLIFAFAGSASSAAVYSPDVAKNGNGSFQGFPFLAPLDTANATQIRQTTAEYSSIQTRNQVDALWGSGTPVTNGILLVNSGTVFLAKSNKGLVVLIQVRDVISSTSGTGSFFGKAKF